VQACQPGGSGCQPPSPKPLKPGLQMTGLSPVNQQVRESFPAGKTVQLGCCAVFINKASTFAIQEECVAPPDDHLSGTHLWATAACCCLYILEFYFLCIVP
jgi:hypothetical protein